jgi:hypothetical protein
MARSRQQPQPTKRLAFTFDPVYADMFSVLRARVREAGHARPSQKTLIQALIHHAPKNGRVLEMDLLVPYRKAHEDAE